MELQLGSARGGKIVAQPLELFVVRELGEEDRQELENPSPLGSKPTTLGEIRHQHHMLAQVLVSGVDAIEASGMTGFSPTYISILKNDPTFAELLVFYESQREIKFVDVLDRMRVLGISTVEELASRLESEPAKFSNRELMEMADLMLLKPKAVTPSGAGGQNVSISVGFVSPPTMAAGFGTTIDLQVDDRD